MGVVIPHAKPAAAKAPDIASLPIPDTLAALHVSAETGFARTDVDTRRKAHGFNEVAEKKEHPALVFLGKFWGLSAWMLEQIMVLSAVLAKFSDLAVVGALLVVNAVLSFMQEHRAPAIPAQRSDTEHLSLLWLLARRAAFLPQQLRPPRRARLHTTRLHSPRGAHTPLRRRARSSPHPLPPSAQPVCHPGRNARGLASCGTRPVGRSSGSLNHELDGHGGNEILSTNLEKVQAGDGAVSSAENHHDGRTVREREQRPQGCAAQVQPAPRQRHAVRPYLNHVTELMTSCARPIHCTARAID